MVEMMIVVFIIAILIIVASKAFGSAKKSTYASEGKAVGSAYMQALSQYHADFANRHPTTWTGNNDATAKRGPLNLTSLPYMRATPEAVGDGRTGVSVNTNCGGLGAPTGATNETSWVSICLGAEPQASVRVVARRSAGSSWTAADGALICWMGATGSPRC